MTMPDQEFYKREIEARAKQLSISVEVMDLGYSQVLRRKLEQKFADPGDKLFWRRFKDRSGKKDKGGWSKLGSKFEGEAAYFFLERDEDQLFYKVEDGLQLSYLLAECFQFEVYVTDINLKKLFCFNSFDVMVQAGAKTKILH